MLRAGSSPIAPRSLGRPGLRLGCEPLLLQERVEVFVPPRRLVSIDALAEMTFPLHTELLHDAPGRVFSGWQVAITGGPTATRSRIAAVPPPPRSRSPAPDTVGERPSRSRRCGGEPGMKPHVPNQSILRPKLDGIGPRFSVMVPAMNCLVCSSVITPSGT